MQSPIRTSTVWLGIVSGLFLSLVCGLIYLVVLHEPGSLFYPFAGFVFLGSPLVAGGVASVKTPALRWKAAVSAAVLAFGLALGMFIFAYAVLPQWDRRNVQLPDICDGFDGSFDPPEARTYTVPGVPSGILIIGDATTAVVALVDFKQPSYPTRVLIVDLRKDQVLNSLQFGNDVISAALANNIVYLFNVKLGYLIDAQTGQFEDVALTIDNYGGLSETDRPLISRASSGHWFMETTAVISSWHIDGRVISRPHLTFNGIARGCFISGTTGEVTPY